MISEHFRIIKKNELESQFKRLKDWWIARLRVKFKKDLETGNDKVFVKLFQDEKTMTTITPN